MDTNQHSFSLATSLERAAAGVNKASGCLRVLRALVESPFTESAFYQLLRQLVTACVLGWQLLMRRMRCSASRVTSHLSQAPCVRVNLKLTVYSRPGQCSLFCHLIFIYTTKHWTKYPGILMVACVTHIGVGISENTFHIISHSPNDPLIYRHFLLILSHIPGASHSNIRTVSNNTPSAQNPCP